VRHRGWAWFVQCKAAATRLHVACVVGSWSSFQHCIAWRQLEGGMLALNTTPLQDSEQAASADTVQRQAHWQRQRSGSCSELAAAVTARWQSDVMAT
jgi:hypothetical protein